MEFDTEDRFVSDDLNTVDGATIHEQLFGTPAVSSESRDAALEVRRRFEAAKAKIEADPKLSAAGKAEELAGYEANANAELAKLAQADAAAAADERATLERRLLRGDTVIGSAADKIAATAWYRDALARATMTTDPAQLLALQQTANLVGDRVLAKATMVVGLQRGDVAVVNAWSAVNPDVEADVDRLYALTHPRGNGRGDIANLIETAMTFGGVR